MSASELKVYPPEAGAFQEEETQEPACDTVEIQSKLPKSGRPKSPSRHENSGVESQASTMNEAVQKEPNDNENKTDASMGSPVDTIPTEPTDHNDTQASTRGIEKLSVLSPKSDHARPLPLTTNTDSSLPPSPPQKDEAYLDPTPKTPQALQSPLQMPSDYIEKDLPQVPEGPQREQMAGKEAKNGGRNSEDSQSEIQSIMDQFTDETKQFGQGDVLMSPRLELAEHFLPGQAHFPPRKSSLEPVVSSDTPVEHRASASWQSRPGSIQSISSHQKIPPPAVPPKSPPTNSQKTAGIELPSTSVSSSAPSGPPPPEPEPDQPFDFHRFLEQLRHRTADPVAKFLRSFLTEFGKKQWMVHEQVKIISDFLAFITNKMAQCDVWREVSDVEFDNAKEGMEKLVMNRLYSQTFSPAIPPPATPSRSRSRGRKKDLDRYQGPGRRGQHQEDVERDEILAQKVRIYGWVKEEHLDIPPSGAIQFIETLDRTSLTVTDEEFERNVEAAVSAIAERNKDGDASPLLHPEKSALSGPEVTPRNSSEGESYARRKDAAQFSGSEDNAAVAGLLRTIQKPLTTIGRIFSDETDSQREPPPPPPQQTPQQRLSPAGAFGTQQVEEGRRSAERQRGREEATKQQISKLDAQEAAARQASAEAAEARRIQRAEHHDVVE
ncbi:hypothetical protein FQN50_005806 [Emmonsiellopsis sp. PD_5]|nr:hypothetical protein FQN50_005806 [Emmonsiellopsis sp. PD_5]